MVGGNFFMQRAKLYIGSTYVGSVYFRSVRTFAAEDIHSTSAATVFEQDNCMSTTIWSPEISWRIDRRL